MADIIQTNFSDVELKCAAIVAEITERVPGAEMHLCIGAYMVTMDLEKAVRIAEYFTPGNPRYGDPTGIEDYL